MMLPSGASAKLNSETGRGGGGGKGGAKEREGDARVRGWGGRTRELERKMLQWKKVRGKEELKPRK